MAERDQRIEEIQDAAHAHPLVHLALESLDETGDSVRPSPIMGERLLAKLKEQEKPESLLAAVLGLADLAFVLQEKHGAVEAANAIIGALASIQDRIDGALATLPDDGGPLSRLRQLKRDAFGATAPKDASAALGTSRGEHLSNAGFDLTAPSKKR